MPDRYRVVVRYQNQSIPIYVRSAKKPDVWRCPNGRRHPSNWTIRNTFQRLLLLIGPIAYNICLNSDFAEGSRNTPCPSNRTRYIASPSSIAKQIFVFRGTFFDPHCYKESTFQHMWWFFSKMGFFVEFQQRSTAAGNTFFS